MIVTILNDSFLYIFGFGCVSTVRLYHLHNVELRICHDKTVICIFYRQTIQNNFCVFQVENCLSFRGIYQKRTFEYKRLISD